jgi:hypothetical protein
MYTINIYIYGECYIYIYDNIEKFNIKANDIVKRGKLIGYVKTKEDTQPLIAKKCNDQLFRDGEIEKENK